MRISVLGAAGFVGRHLVRELSGRGHRVDGFDLVPTAGPDPLVLPLDVTAPFALPGGTEAVVYLCQHPGYRDFPRGVGQLFAVNTGGAIRTAEAAVEAGARALLFASTGNVYRPSFAHLDEDAPLRRDDPYALSKVAAEEALALFEPRLAVVRMRLFGIFGPGQRRLLASTLLERLQSGAEITLEPKPGEDDTTEGMRISFCFVADCVRRIADLAERAVSGQDTPRALNLSGLEALGIRAFATAMAEVLGVEPRFRVLPTRRAFDLIADPLLSIRTLGPHSTALREALAAMVREAVPASGSGTGSGTVRGHGGTAGPGP